MLRKIRFFGKKLLRRLLSKIGKFESFGADIIYDRSQCTKFITYPLLIFSKIFEKIVRMRYWLYSKNIFLSQSLGCPVIVVGNLTVGGTGKTPVVEKFARELSEKGRKVAVLSRGYKSKRELKLKAFFRWMTHASELPPRVVSNGERVLLGSELAGDEPYMLARNLPGVIVIVDRDRVKAGRYAIEKYGANILILDDGFQYLPLRGHMNLLLIDQTNPFGNGKLLPRGILREPIDHLRRASYILLTKTDIGRDRSVESTIRKILPKANLIKCCHKPKYLRSLTDEKDILQVNALNAKAICTFSGIAMPDSFEHFLKTQGANIVYGKRFTDHHRFTKYELDHMYNAACRHGANFAVTTEKDAVRIPKDYTYPLQTYFLKVEIGIIEGGEVLNEAIMKFISGNKQVN
ncbi:MAG: tetraacyldisaccharide 4'-kinase [Puniceicoccales bacterium]|jgi:tetraacyldisaccharide 4'-kinase|nr:tetraacyldisaccharide 4'-kinase [Puniceicoccales bacterium]